MDRFLNGPAAVGRQAHHRVPGRRGGRQSARPHPQAHRRLGPVQRPCQGTALGSRQRDRVLRDQNEDLRRKLNDMYVERDEYKLAADALARLATS